MKNNKTAFLKTIEQWGLYVKRDIAIKFMIDLNPPLTLNSQKTWLLDNCFYKLNRSCCASLLVSPIGGRRFFQQKPNKNSLRHLGPLLQRQHAAVQLVARYRTWSVWLQRAHRIQVRSNSWSARTAATNASFFLLKIVLLIIICLISDFIGNCHTILIVPSMLLLTGRTTPRVWKYKKFEMKAPDLGVSDHHWFDI